jgi:hypothetical protein
MNLALKEIEIEYSKDLDLFSTGALTPANYKEKVTNAEEYLLTLPQVEPEVTQHFLPGIYSRSITIPTGMILTGGVHKMDSIIFVSQGEIIVATENGNLNIKAPASFIGKRGTKRIAYCVEECVWTNVHQYNGVPQDEDTMKDFIISETYADYEIFLAQEDYGRFLAEIGMTNLQVVALVTQTADVVDFDEKTDVDIAPSPISCNGIVATRYFGEGEYIGKGSHGENRTALTRFTNHSHQPNVLVDMDDGDLIFVASEGIEEGSELTVDYRDVVNLRREL